MEHRNAIDELFEKFNPEERKMILRLFRLLLIDCGLIRETPEDEALTASPTKSCLY